MPRRRLGFAWFVLALVLPLASCVSPTNSAARTRRFALGLAFTPELTPLLPASSERAWRGATGHRRHPRIGVGVTGGVRAGDRIGLDGRVCPGRSPLAGRPQPRQFAVSSALRVGG
jgi:hypothetical protein